MTAEDDHLAVTFPQKPVTIARALGAELWDPTGRRYVDMGAANHGAANFGHNHPRIVAAIRAQLDRVTHIPATLRSPERSQFLERLHKILPSHLTRSFLCNSGTEAIEASLKYAHARTGRSRFVALRNAFHGRTLGALAFTHKPQYRKPFESLLVDVDFVPANDVAALEAAVTEATAAIILEPIQGEGGLTVLTPDFLRAAERIAHAKGALLIVDEIQTGLGRTGHDFGFQPSGIRPDIVAMGKSIAGGVPMGATAITDHVAQGMPPAGHGTTFGGEPLACAAGVAALDVLREERLSERAQRVGEKFRTMLASISSPLVREVRGQGLMMGVDLRIKPPPVLERLMAAGYLALPAGTTVVRFLPPLVVNESDLQGARDALAQALADPALVPKVAAEATE